VSNVKLNFNAFQFRHDGVLHSPNAARVAKSTAISAIISAIKSAGNEEQQALVLCSVLLHEQELQEIADAAGFRSKDMEAKLFLFEQIKEMLELATK
jgi:hypothetical protein